MVGVMAKRRGLDYWSKVVADFEAGNGRETHEVETILGKRDLAIRASAASSVSRLPIPFTLTVGADRARRDRKTALLPDRLQFCEGKQRAGR